MRAITQDRYGSPDALELEELDQPAPKEDEVLVRVMASSANPRDWHLMRGLPLIARPQMGQRKPKWRFPGSDVAGPQAATPAASRPLRIGPAVRLLGGGRRSYVDGLGALLTLGDVELDRLALVQRAIVLDGAGVHEHVGAGLGLNEAVALLALNHLTVPPVMLLVLRCYGSG